MSAVSEHIEGNLGPFPAEDLEEQVRAVLDHAVDAHHKNLKVYESLRNLNEVIGTEYGDRVLYELIQNAHDAHRQDDKGRIAIRLAVRSEAEGVLYIANGGDGFRPEDVDAIKNLATTAKKIGEGIGNKGLGFRSIEALTDDVRIFSRTGRKKTDRFDGYCFRFANVREIESLMRANEVDTTTAEEVARVVPRYLVPRPLHEQPDDVISYARRGYATVIVVPLHTAEAVELAKRQVKVLADLDVPLLLFLDRIAEFRIDIETPDRQPYRRRLRRRQSAIGDIPGFPGCRLFKVGVGEDRRFLVVRCEVDKERVLDAVKRSVSRAPQIERWRDWKGQPVVSVAVGLSTGAVTKGCFYNFLPMDDEAESPLFGYLDAPFFADINRRNADFDLPLNETLMKAAAETCAAAALSIAERRDTDIPQRAVFDLVAWTGEHAEKLDEALEEVGGSLRDAPIVPTIAFEGKKGWSSLSEVGIWPDGKFSLLKAREVAKRVGAQLVSDELDSHRLDRLREMAQRKCLHLSPTSRHLAEWSEHFAASLLERKATPRTWACFYEDLNRVFDAANKNLKALSGKRILYDRSKKLRAAGGHDGTSGASVFVRSEASKGKRAKDSVPLPPSTLARRYRFLDEKIKLDRKTLNAFIGSNLVRGYDPAEALAGIKSALGNRANENRRREALLWAFKVWQRAGVGVEEALRSAELYVLTWTGWQPARRTAFSSSWTPLGRTLENFLIEAAEVSPDCQRARDMLLVGFNDWPVSASDTKHHWVEFLKLLGVEDGLRPVAARVQDSGNGWSWDRLLCTGDVEEGLDGDWHAETSLRSSRHPSTEYRRKGEAWRLPGQIEHEKLPDTVKEVFSELAFKHIEAHGTKFLTFEVGRFERHQRYWDHRRLPTPLATFLRSKAWIAVNTQEGMAFRNSKECWASRVSRGGPPRFVDCIPKAMADFSEGGALAELAFGKALGLRDWRSQETAVARLQDLASVAASLASNDRPTARNEYRRAWLDVVETGVSLPDDISLIVTRRGQLEVLDGESDAPTNIIVTEDAQRFEARILSAAGRPVLEVGATSMDRIADLLEGTGSFIPHPLDGIGAQLLVDGEPFAPRSIDPLLTSLGLDWLPEVIVIGHEIRGEQLERGIQSSTVDRRARAIRVRRCKAMALVVDDKEVSPSEHLGWYAVEHETLPTLILTHDLSLDWMTLARSLSGGISRLIDSRLRSLEPLLLRLALDRSSDELDAPSDEALARALDCDVQTVRDHRDALRTDLERILHLLIPVVAYYAGTELSQQLRRDVDRAGARFDPRKWLQLRLSGKEYSPEELIEACEQAANRTELRRQLELDYEKFNRVLLDLGEPTLSNEAELRRLYAAYLGRMRPMIIERLRRHHAADFQQGNNLTDYVEQKSLSFLAFDPEWIPTRETLEMELVKAHVSALLSGTLGEDVPAKLAPLNRVVKTNQESVREFATRALPILRVWCRQNAVSLPEPWNQAEAQAVVRHVENSGLLDFEVIKAKGIPAICRRASCWPASMPETLDEKALGLDKDEVEEEEKRRERTRQQREIARRSIEFAGSSLDTGDPMFAENLQGIATDWLSRDETWFERSRQRPRLVEFQNPDQSAGGSSGGGKGGVTRRRDRQLTDAQRQGMGLASEWLAFQFLHRRHSHFVDETCWISENRTRFFGGDEGDDTAGYDFLVKTPQADWLYEVKSSLEDTGEFELTANEMRVAGSASKDGRRRYRILYVPFVFSPDRWFVLELPNPMGETTRNRFKVVRSGSVRLRFER